MSPVIMHDVVSVDGFIADAKDQVGPSARRAAFRITRCSLTIPTIIAGLFFDGVALLLLYILVVIARETPSRRSQATPAPAGRVRPPDRGHHGHHGSGVHRPARRGRGRR